MAFNTLQVANYVGVRGGGGAGADPTGVALHDPAVKPDIYYIILDRYANADTLSEIYKFDNEPFLDELEARGFSIAHHAWANYLDRCRWLAEHELHRSGAARRGHEQAVHLPRDPGRAPHHLAGPSALKSIGC